MWILGLEGLRTAHCSKFQAVYSVALQGFNVKGLLSIGIHLRKVSAIQRP